MPKNQTLRVRTSRPMRLLVANAETVDHYDEGSVVELEARSALELIALGHADGVPADEKPAKKAAKKAAKKTTADE